MPSSEMLPVISTVGEPSSAGHHVLPLQACTLTHIVKTKQTTQYFQLMWIFKRNEKPPAQHDSLPPAYNLLLLFPMAKMCGLELLVKFMKYKQAQIVLFALRSTWHLRAL